MKDKANRHNGELGWDQASRRREYTSLACQDSGYLRKPA